MIGEQELLSHFIKVLPRGKDKWQASCCCHEDRKPSLSITRTSNKWLLHCFSCDRNGEEIAEYLGIPTAELFTEEYKRGLEIKPNENEIEYQYYSFDGKGIWDYDWTFSKLKNIHTHKYRVVHMDNHGVWKNKKPEDCKPSVYAPAGIEAVKHSKTIAICEGEKDAYNVFNEGLCSFTYGSSSDWRDDFAELTRDKDIIIFQDNDDAGRAVTAKIEKSIEGIAKSVLVICPTPNIEHGDISDYLEAGGNIHALIADAQQGEVLSNDITVRLREHFNDDRFKSLDAEAKLTLLATLYLPQETTLKDNQTYINRAWLRDLGIIGANNTNARNRVTNELKDKHYIREVGKNKQGYKIYEVLEGCAEMHKVESG